MLFFTALIQESMDEVQSTRKHKSTYKDISKYIQIYN